MIVLWVVLGRHWDVELFGYFNYFFAYISIIGIFFDFGLDVLLIKLISKKQNYAIPKNCWRLKKYIFIVVLISSTGLGYLLDFPLQSLLLFILGVILLSFCSYFNAIFRARDQLHIEAKIGLLQKITFIGLSLLAVIYFKQGILFIALAYFSSHLLVFLLTLNILYKKNWLLIQSTNTEIEDYWHQSWPLFITALLAVLAIRLDVFLLQWLTDLQQLGYYTAAMRLFEGTTIISSAFIAVIFPKFVAKSQDHLALSKFYQHTQKILSFVGIAIIIPGIFMIPMAIILLYGNKFLPSILILQSLLPLLVIVFLTALAGNLLIALGKQHQYMKLLAIMLVFQIIVNFFAIQLWGTMGVVYSYWCREIILLVMATLYIRKTFSLS